MDINGTTIKPGDVLLKHSNQGASAKDFFAHGFIKTTQKLQHLQGDASVVHAAIYTGGAGNLVVEAVGAGVVFNSFNAARPDYRWEFWRCQAYPGLAALAADLAANLAERKKVTQGAFGNYAMGQAMKQALGAKFLGQRGVDSEANELDNFLSSVGVDDEVARATFFCSEIVTFIYHLAARIDSVNFRRVLDLDYRRALPSKLKSKMAASADWQYLGEDRGFTC